MEIEKVIRILIVFLVVAAFAVKIATQLMFPESSQMSFIPITVMLILCLANIWRQPKKENENSNK